MNILLIEDEFVPQLYPVTVGRPAFSITCGGNRLIEQIASLGGVVRGVVRPHLREILPLDFPQLMAGQEDPTQPTLLLNARLVPSADLEPTLAEIVRTGQPAVVWTQRVAAAAYFPHGLPAGANGAECWRSLSTADLPVADAPLPLLDYPHDIVRYHMQTLGPNLERRLATGGYHEVADGVFIALGARVGQYVVTDTRRGPIVIEADATIGPYSYLSGPAWIGRGARVLEHSSIKDGVSLGHTTKIGGEVEASVIEPYSNKQHHGFLGHSYLGSWINLGAGTCNSDLKNTYGQVNMEYHGRKVATGMQFVGAMIGDYAKTAINTGIFTGKTIGVCSMVYGFVTTNVPSFVNYARLFGQVTEAPVEVMIATQSRMFTRRSVAQRPEDIRLLQAMYDLTRHERQLAGEPLTL